ncbi:MAG: permease [Nannocystaceae bacterium]
MIEAIAITVGSILVGALVGGVRRRESSWLGPLRTFAVAAVATAVIVQLLPESVAEAGGGALLVFVGALALPGLLAPLARRLRPASKVSVHRVGAELGFYGFLAHQLAEGLALGTVAGKDHGGLDHAPLVLAVAAHTLPLTAVFVVEALSHGGRRTAARRVTAVVLATVTGFGLADVASQRLHLELHAWLSAAVAGLLVHVIFHHDHQRRGPRTAWVSALDVLGAAVGVALPLLAAHAGSDDHGDSVRTALGEAFGELLLETAPMLLLGLGLGALLLLIGPRAPSRRYRDGGPETLTLTVQFLGWPFAILRLVAALGLAGVLARLVRSDSHEPPTTELPAPARAETTSTGSGTVVQAAHAFDELLRRIAPWTFVGLLAAAFVEVIVGEGSLAGLAETGLDVLVVTAIAMPSYVCPASATPLAAVLVTKGISSGAVLVGLLLGPATSLATIGALRRGYGTRAVVLGLLVTLGLSVALGTLVNRIGISAQVPEHLGQAHEHGVIAVGSVGLLGLLLAQLWRRGTRPWLEVLEGSHEHADAHGNGDPGPPHADHHHH